MAFCKSCGQELGSANFCPKCGANQSGAAAPTPAPVTAPSEGLQENIAGLLCYVLGWLTGIVFLLIDKRPFVKFHAAQSIVVFGGLHVIHYALRFLLHPWAGFFLLGLAGLVHLAVGLLGFVLWIILMIKAYQHEMFKVPLAAPFAESIAGK